MTYKPSHPIDTFDDLIFLAAELNDGRSVPNEFRLDMHKWIALAQEETLELMAAALGQWAAGEAELVPEAEETPHDKP